PMAELADEWAGGRRANVWGTVPTVVEMQSEGGAAGALHGALQSGALTTTFTASQGLLLMIPNMYKIAGELTPAVLHVAARVPDAVTDAMDRLAARTGRRYGIVEYAGDPGADRVVVLMGSGAQTARETVDHLTARGERVGVLEVRLFRPFPTGAVLAALPATA